MRSVIITGGFGVLGRAVALAFSNAGDRVARVDFAQTAPDTIDNGLDLPGVDLTHPNACATAVQAVVEAFGRVDVLVNIAGGFTWETLADGGVATWQRMFDTNVVTAVNMIKAAIPHLQASEAGRVVNIGAGAAQQAAMGMGAYAASKAAVHRLTESLAAELGSTAITVNAVLPSIIDTPTNRADMPDADTSGWVQPQAIADVILFLASRQARAITGALVPVMRGSAD